MTGQVAPPLAAEIIRALRDGYGVEDIAVRGIATIEQAREVIARLRGKGLLRQALWMPKRRKVRA